MPHRAAPCPRLRVLRDQGRRRAVAVFGDSHGRFPQFHWKATVWVWVELYGVHLNINVTHSPEIFSVLTELRSHDFVKILHIS